MVSVFIAKPVLDDRMSCWTCLICISADEVRERKIYGASSLQALSLAASIVPSLILTFFPGEEFMESGTPVVLSTDT